MNKVFLIGNLTRDPELRTTQAGDAVCTLTIAVNRRRTARAGQPEADFFRVTAWRQLGENCAKWLIKGKKVSVVGTVSASAYMGNDGQPHANLEVTADDVEFLSPANTVEDPQPAQAQDFRGQQHNNPQPPGGGFIQVDEESLPF
ncbi:MAG: single-stranded DNA-binding protein [Acidaminococcaceae bacterium]|nr:single-stranded DNA-binding protein [Acidaminococcaceae bacterium]